MVKFFLHIYDFLHARRGLCMSLMCLFTVMLVVMMATLKYNENIYDFLPMTGNNKKAITLYQDISGGQRIIVAFKMNGKDSLNVDRVTEAVDTFAEKIESSNGKRHISEITTQVDFDKYASISDFIYQNIPVMLTDSDYLRMESKLGEPHYADEQLQSDVRMIMMPATGYFATNISNDPLGLFAPVMERLQAKQATLPIEIDNGYIFSPGKRYALVMLKSPYGAMESANNALLVNFVDSVAEATMKAMPDVKIEATGSPVIAVGNASQIKTDSQWAISIAVTLILLLLVFSFRKVKNLLLIGVAIIFGWLFAMGFIAVLRSDVSLIVLGIGSIIIGIVVNYPLHFIAHTDHGGTIRDVLKEMVSPLLIGNITTVGAFASLIPLNATALRDLGLFAAFMLIGTILFVLVFLPHLVKERVKAEEERLLFGKISTKSPEHNRWLLWCILCLTLVFGYFSLNTTFDANMNHINYLSGEQKELLSGMNISAGLNDTTNVYIVTEGKTWDEALTKREAVSKTLDTLKASGHINRYSDVTSFICSKEEQQERIQRWNTFWAKHRDEVKKVLRDKAPAYGFNADAFEGFYQIIDNSYTTHTFDYYEQIRAVLLSSSFSSSTGKYSVVDVLDAKNKDKAGIEDAIDKTVGDSGYSFDFVGMNSSIANSLSNDFNYIGFACGFIVFLFLWISFGRLELSLLAFLPMALGWIWILGIMDICNMQFNIVNIILATFIFGQGDDYTIFMTDGLIEEFAYRKKLLPSFKNSIIISALIMFIGMGSLIVAKHPALHSLAEVTIVGMLTVVMMAWIVPPLVFDWLIKTDGKVRQIPVSAEQILRTVYSAVFYILELAFGCIVGYVLRLLPGDKKAKEDFMHRLIYRTMKASVSYLWGIKSSIRNDVGEDFSRGSMVICNHQSILDPIYMLAMHPKVLILISEKVWKNPIVHPMFKIAGFINLNQPMENMQEDIAKAINKGYNVVIFPEGKRTNGQIVRFHKGAFHIAQQIGADILPVYLHGANHVMPKGSAFASRGRVDVEIGKRISNDRLKDYGDDSQAIAHSFKAIYVKHFDEIKREIEDTHYFHHYVIAKYTYKGIGVEKETRRLLKQHDDFSRWIDGYTSESGSVTILNAGKGQFSLLFALVHPELMVEAYITDADDYALASCCEPMPKNLHYHHVQTMPEVITPHDTFDFLHL